MNPGATSNAGKAAVVPLTVRGLTEIPNLETRLHAGAGGAEGVITWAHAIEIQEPWTWLEAGDLLMTVGLGLPAKPEEQVTYVEKLSEVGVSGIALGDGFPLPPLSEQMIEASERCAMPILFIGWNIPFGQISRVVAAANYGPQLGRLVKAVRIYDLVREAVTTRASPLDLFHQLEAETACRLYVCSNENGSPAFGQTPPAEIHEVFLEAIQERTGRLPGFLRLAAGADTLLVIPVPTQRPASLLAVPETEVPPFAILQHVATVAALELERMWSTREELRRLGSETLAQLMEGRLIQGTTAALERLGFEEGPLVVLALENDGNPQLLADLHNTLADEQIPNLLVHREGMLYTLLRDDDAIVDRVATLLPDGTHAGASERFQDPTKAPMASQQAKWALGTATPAHPLARHGHRSSLFGPRSPAEAQMTVEQVLGPLIAYDEEHNAELLRSLQVFLQCNRSWKRAAEELFVHKQTLIYRMGRVEELSGRKLNHTADVAELWLALRAYQMVG